MWGKGICASEEAAHRAEYKGHVLYFCSEEDEEEFKKNPEKYFSELKQIRQEKHITTDPVCGMKVEPEEAAGKVEYKGYVFYFCSEEHEREFRKNPEKYFSEVKQKKLEKHETHHH
nr:YHS domain-containing protein [Candidatus Freyarchaeota archaeon]